MPFELDAYLGPWMRLSPKRYPCVSDDRRQVDGSGERVVQRRVFLMRTGTGQQSVQASGGLEYWPHPLQELAGRLHPSNGAKDGRFNEKKEFKDAPIVYPKCGRLKMLSLTVDHSTFPPVKQTTEVGGGAALLGVIEYVQRGDKTCV